MELLLLLLSVFRVVAVVVVVVVVVMVVAVGQARLVHVVVLGKHRICGRIFKKHKSAKSLVRVILMTLEKKNTAANLAITAILTRHLFPYLLARCSRASA